MSLFDKEIDGTHSIIRKKSRIFIQDKPSVLPSIHHIRPFTQRTFHYRHFIVEKFWVNCSKSSGKILHIIDQKIILQTYTFGECRIRWKIAIFNKIHFVPYCDSLFSKHIFSSVTLSLTLTLEVSSIHV